MVTSAKQEQACSMKLSVCLPGFGENGRIYFEPIIFSIQRYSPERYRSKEKIPILFENLNPVVYFVCSHLND